MLKSTIFAKSIKSQVRIKLKHTRVLQIKPNNGKGIFILAGSDALMLKMKIKKD